MIIATFTITEERKETYNFSEPYYIDEIGFLVKKDSPLADIGDMNGKTIGVGKMGTAKQALETQAKELNLNLSYKQYDSYPEIKAALLTGEVDVFSVDKSILRGYDDDQTTLLDYGFNPQEYGIATKKENKALADRINSFIQEIKENGELDKIIAKWNV